MKADWTRLHCPRAELTESHQALFPTSPHLVYMTTVLAQDVELHASLFAFCYT